MIGDGEEGPALRGAGRGISRTSNSWAASPTIGFSRYYEHSIAAIVPSIGYETFGIVLVEAFRFQTPVIARRMGPFPEIVDQSNGGVLFSNEAELLAAMARLQRDAGLRDQLGVEWLPRLPRALVGGRRHHAVPGPRRRRAAEEGAGP